MNSVRLALRALLFFAQLALWRLVMFFDKGDRYRGVIRNHGIIVFVGPNGSGKSLAAVDSVLEVLRGETWDCRALEHDHNMPLARHVLGCDVCSLGSILRLRMCRWQKFRDLLGMPATDRHRLRCAECEWFPGQLGGRCVDAEGIGLVCGRGERLVYSTVPLLDDDGQPHPRYRPCTDYRQLIGIEHAVVLFDEVAGVSDASDSSGVPPQLVRWLQQLRKRDVFLRVTSPAYERCSKPIRQVAQVVVDARSFFPSPSSTGAKWRPRRAMLYRAYDAFAFDQFTHAAANKAVQGKGNLRSMARMAYWLPGSEAPRRYDTLAQVLALGDVNEAGMCMVCGGARSRPKCACPPGLDHDDETPVEVVETVSPSGGRVRRGQPVPVELRGVGAPQ